MSHTPGPWRFEDHGSHTPAYIYATDETEVAMTTGRNKKANARLIAAAPDLLVAAERSLVAWQRYLDTDVTDVMTDALTAVLLAVRAANGQDVGA